MKRTLLLTALWFSCCVLLHLNLSCQNSTGQQGNVVFNAKDSFPKPISYVNDFEKLYAPEQAAYLNKLIREFEELTTIQIALVTLDSSFTSRVNFDDYTLQLARDWGVGTAEKNNGILIGISKDLKYMRIQNGIGIEAMLTDSETKRIVDSLFIPSFKNGNYFSGTLNGLEGIISHLNRKLKKGN